MFADALTLKYIALVLLGIWGVLLIFRLRNHWLAWLAGLGVFLAIIWLALGSGFSIRIPYIHGKMEVITYTVHNNRVHALAHPLGQPDTGPMHIVFSIDPASRTGSRMRKSFFAAVRAREGKRHKTKIIIDMRGYMTEQGVRKYKLPPSLPPKQ